MAPSPENQPTPGTIGGAPELSVIAPCFNEGPNIQVLVDRTVAAFDEMSIPCELLLINDGSRDDTWQNIQRAAEGQPRVRGFTHVTNKGIVQGWRTGLEASQARLVCLIDSDLQNRPEDIVRLHETYVKEKPDIVQAVRHPRVNKNRIVFSRGLNTILNVTFNMHLRDNKSGFILCRRPVLDAILEDAPPYRYFQSFVGVAAHLRGYTFAEVDTDFDPRNAGESFLSNFPIKFSLRVLQEVARYRVDTLLHERRKREV